MQEHDRIIGATSRPAIRTPRTVAALVEYWEVFVPSFSMENAAGNTRVLLSINATGDIMAGKHALQAAISAANALGVEQGAGNAVQRWTALLGNLPAYRVNGDNALAEWSWPSLGDNYNHRYVHHLYGA